MRATWVVLAVVLTIRVQAQTDLLYLFEKQVINPEMQHATARQEVFNAAPTGNYDLQYQRCQWYLNPDTLFVSGTITSYFIVTENTSTIYFDCSDSLIIDSVLYHGSNMAFTLLANEVLIPLPDELTIGLLDSISVIYHGNPVSSGFGSFEITEHATANTIWTLSEPYGASDWWPCKQTLDDKIDSLDVFVTTPIGFSSGGPGLLIDTLSDGVNTTFHWKTNYPIANYLIGVAVSNYKCFQLYAPNNGDSVLLYNMVYPENFDEALAGVSAIVPSFELYANTFGDYPFAEEKYGQLQFGWGGGMEHQTMSSVTSRHRCRR